MGGFLAATDIPRECQSRFVSILLSKPIYRRHYVIGKFLGLFATSYLLYLLLILVLALFSHAHFPSWNTRFQVLLTGIVAGWYLAPVLAVAVASSTLVDEVPAVVMTVLYMLASFGLMFVPFVLPWIASWPARFLVALHLPFANPLYFLFPRWEPIAVFWLALYAGCGSFLFCRIAIVGFERKDLC